MNVKTFEEVRQRFLEITFEERFDLIVAVANGGIIPAAMLNQRLNLDMQLLKLHLRDADQKQLYDRPRLLEEIRFEYWRRRICCATFALQFDLLENFFCHFIF